VAKKTRKPKKTQLGSGSEGVSAVPGWERVLTREAAADLFGTEPPNPDQRIAALRQIQAEMKKFAPGRSLSEELMAERRAEAAAEEAEAETHRAAHPKLPKKTKPGWAAAETSETPSLEKAMTEEKIAGFFGFDDPAEAAAFAEALTEGERDCAEGRVSFRALSAWSPAVTGRPSF
jgi:hypothetical protein